eukprot:763152-Hanusia_phi.AAC.2
MVEFKVRHDKRARHGGARSRRRRETVGESDKRGTREGEKGLGKVRSRWGGKCRAALLAQI